MTEREFQNYIYLHKKVELRTDNIGKSIIKIDKTYASRKRVYEREIIAEICQCLDSINFAESIAEMESCVVETDMLLKRLHSRQHDVVEHIVSDVEETMGFLAKIAARIKLKKEKNLENKLFSLCEVGQEMRDFVERFMPYQPCFKDSDLQK